MFSSGLATIVCSYYYFFRVYAFYRNCCIIYDPIVTTFVNQTFAKLLFLTFRLLRKYVIDLYIYAHSMNFYLCLLGSVDPGQTGPR